MSYKQHIGTESNLRGQKAEDDFFVLLKERHPDARAATMDEQFKHIDYVWSKGSIDVKAMKALSRGSSTQNDLIWVEFKNNTGADGWLFGEQDFVAFEEPDRYTVVPRKTLATLCELFCRLDEKVHSPRDALYKSYTRSGKKDVISIVKMEDIKKLRHWVIPKKPSAGAQTTL